MFLNIIQDMSMLIIIINLFTYTIIKFGYQDEIWHPLLLGSVDKKCCLDSLVGSNESRYIWLTIEEDEEVV